MPNETMMFCRFSKEDERLKKWWSNLPDRHASNRLRKAVNFYLDFKKFRNLLELLNLLQISPEGALKLIKDPSIQSSKPGSIPNSPERPASNRTATSPLPKSEKVREKVRALLDE